MAKAKGYSRVHRLLRVIHLVQGGGGWNAARLAKACETTERSIYRDLKCIGQSGVPISFDEATKSYVIGREFFLPPVQLTVEEALAVIALGEGVGEGGSGAGNPLAHMKPALSASRKVRSQLNPAIRTAIDKSADRVKVNLAASSPEEGTADAFTKARTAIEQRRVLDCVYDSLSASRKGEPGRKLRLSPYELVFEQRAWYVVGHSSAHNEVRNFKLGRFSKLTLTDQTFDVPSGWSLEKHRGMAWRMVRGDRRHDVEIEFSADFAETVADTQWHRTQQTELLEDGRMKFTCTVDGLDEIVWWVLSMGPHAKVVRPLELVKRVKELAGQMSALYAGASGSNPPSGGDVQTSVPPKKGTTAPATRK